MIYTASWKSVTESVMENTTYAASQNSVTESNTYGASRKTVTETVTENTTCAASWKSVTFCLPIYLDT